MPARLSRRSSRPLKRVAGRLGGRSTSAASFTRWRETSNRVTGRKAVRPDRKPSALDFQPSPSAVTTPAPVMTTRGGDVGCWGGGNSTILAFSGSNVRNRVGKNFQRVKCRERVETGPGDLLCSVIPLAFPPWAVRLWRERGRIYSSRVNSILNGRGQCLLLPLAMAVTFWLSLHQIQYSSWYKGRLYEHLLHGNENQQMRAASELAHFGGEQQLLEGLKAGTPAVRDASRRALEYLWFSAAGRQAHRTVESAYEAAEKKEFKTALALLNEVVREHPKFAEGWNRRASVYWQIGQYEKSIADCEKAIALNPSHYGAWQGMGVCRIELGNIAEACRCLRAALRISPFDDTTRHCLEKCEELLRVMRGPDRTAKPSGDLI